MALSFSTPVKHERICLLLRTYHVRCYDIGGSSRKMVERQLTECLFLLLAQASSLPVVVVSSTNQIPSAWAALMWCSMLSSSEPRVRPPHLYTTDGARFEDLCCCGSHPTFFSSLRTSCCLPTLLHSAGSSCRRS